MDVLIGVLARWPGRRETEALLAARGYRLPAHYQEVVAFGSCSDAEVAALNRYWDEVALEHFCSAGRAVPDRRKFLGETSYRSDYLDSLAAVEENHEMASQGLPLDPCLRKFMTKINEGLRATQGQGFGHQIRRKMEQYKKIEIENFGISAGAWAGTRADFTNILKECARSRGFVSKKKWWEKSLGNGLVFRCGVDTGMRTSWRFQLPLWIEISHQAVADTAFQASLVDRLVPSFEYYALYDSPSSAILGVTAYVELLDIVALLIAAAQEFQGIPKDSDRFR
jgi:hypothetical protein